MEAVVRGLYVEARVGGGAMLVNPKFKPISAYPEAGGTEQFGAGPMVHGALGYDLTSTIALEVVVGATMASGRKLDWVRDLGLYFGGAAARVALALGERLLVLGSVGGAYLSANNSVEAAQSGPAVLVNFGVEYYVHVRHFSVGVALSGLVPVSPFRAFVGLAPQLKYSF